MRATEFLIEAGLAKSDFYKADRIAVLAHKIKEGLPFLKTDGTTVVLKKDTALIKNLEAQAAKGILITKQNKGQIPYEFLDGENNPVKLSELQKTTEFGSSAKELMPVKPSNLVKLSGTDVASAEDLDDPVVIKQIVSSKTFLANDLAKRVISDPILNKGSGKLGKAIIHLAKQISTNHPAILPPGLLDPEIKAIRDYAGEYLGILQLIYGQSKFENKEAFFKHLGTSDLGTLNLYFPKLSSTPLADSIAIRNNATGDMMKISSKGGKIGAPPSLDSLKVPDEIRKSKPRSKTIRFMDTARSSKAASQPFILLNALYSMNPSMVEEKHEGMSEYLPFTTQDIQNFINADKFTEKDMPSKVKHFLWAGSDYSGAGFGNIHYYVNTVVRDIVNNTNILPDLNSTVLEILGSNFIQIYSNISKSGVYSTVVKWPNKVDGKIQLYSKASAGEPTKGKMSWYLS